MNKSAIATTTTTNPNPARSRWARLGKIAGGTTLLLVGAVGFLHTKAGRPLLAAVGVACPATRVSPAEVESVRQRALTTLRGKTPAAARPAFGLALDESTLAQVTAWAAARGLDCGSGERPTRRLTCRDVPTAALPASAQGGPVDEVNFTFFPDGRLLGIETLRRQLTGADAARLFTTITASLDAKVGDPTERTGDATAQYLGSAAMHTAFARYRYSNYLATVTAMNLSGRVALREQYQSALPPG